MRPKFIRACLKKWRTVLHKCDRCCGLNLWPSTLAPLILRDEDSRPIPRDVPKGHLAVYVGEDEKRYVIRVSVLDDPLFLALLDEAREVYDYGRSRGSGSPATRTCLSTCCAAHPGDDGIC
ncbi:hypothetical protein MLD38_020373 [Melastoma candidum]|uniref:Uncharacterized protein n=1 Tax=Melastoma candidum TaxID=119954 RepID=A0ACB9QCU7_9MYRT|nr:hypothetical protein MLD38_020373 [Melastoma candidum]